MTTVSEKRKGTKRVRGQGVHWSQPKSLRTIRLTDEAWEALKVIGDELGGLGRSEAIERWVRGQLPDGNSSATAASKDIA